MKEDVLYNARMYAAKEGTNEPKAMVENISLNELFKQRQQIIAEMNSARLDAIIAAEQPFKKQLEELDQQYGMLLMLTGKN